MRTAVYPGSFDPVTHGHLDIIRRGAKLADRLIVAVAVNVGRDPLFTLDERLDMLKAEVKGIRGVSVARFDGMVVDFARRQGAQALIRGLRNVTDFEYEFPMAHTNRVLGKLETVFVVAHQEYAFLNARLIREVATLGGDVSTFVPRRVVRALRSKLREQAWAS